MPAVHPRQVHLRRRGQVLGLHPVGVKDVRRLLGAHRRHAAPHRRVAPLQHPRVARQLRQRDALLGVHAQHAPQQRLHLRAEPRRDLVAGRHDLLEQPRQRRLVERKAACQHHVQHHPQRPDVRRRARIALLGQHLRRDVVWRPARRHQLAVLGVGRLRQRTQPKVRQLGGPVLCQQHVLRLEVAVVYALRVAVGQRVHELVQHLPSLPLVHAPLRHDLVEELPARHQLHHHVDLLRRRHHLLEVHHVGVLQVLQDCDLRLNLVRHVLPRQLLLVQDLDGHRLACLCMLAILHLGVSTLSQGSAKQVVPDPLLEYGAWHRGARLGWRQKQA
mmetsp:Transcript_17532/g.44529  ORF Transcript_17532/g.44529 Transcript_17532/m.44529 type:complete len:331 (-) Transcript_17532:174-1166(-)